MFFNEKLKYYYSSFFMKKKKLDSHNDLSFSLKTFFL